MLPCSVGYLSRAFYAKVSWKGNRVTHCRLPATSIARFDAPSVSRCRSTCLPTLRGSRKELHKSGSTLAFVMPRDAEPLAHRWFAGPARALQPFCVHAADPFRNKPCSVGPASPLKRTQECMNDSRKFANCDAEQSWQRRTTELSVSGRWKRVRRSLLFRTVFIPMSL
jgi:hypothetical protein